MKHRDFLRQLSTSGQGLNDIPADITEELVRTIKMASFIMGGNQIVLPISLDGALNLSLALYTLANPRTAITEINYQEHTELFDVTIDKVGREIISLTMDDIKSLANIPID